MDKETSSRVSAIAGQLINIKPERLAELYRDHPTDFTTLCDDIRTLAASCLSHDETPGQEKTKRKHKPEISVTIEGNKKTINVDYGHDSYQTWFNGNDMGTINNAISSLIEQICGFPRGQILIELYAAMHPDEPKGRYVIEPTEDKRTMASATTPEINSDPVEIGGHDEARDGPIPFDA